MALDTPNNIYRYIFDNVNDAIFIHDLDGHFIDVNRIACERLGYTREELLAMSVQQLDAPEFAEHFTKSIDNFLKKGSLVAETVHVRKDGTRIPIEISAQIIEYDGKPATLSVARDLRERKRAEAEIQQLQEQIQNMAIRVERERLGRELHDGLGQVLGFIGVKSAAIFEMLKQNRIAEAQKAIQELNDVTQTAYADVREAILDLRTNVSGSISLEAALREYLHRYQREWNIATELVIATEALACLSPIAEIQLLRIIQEALTNVRKHARARQVQLHLERANEQLHVMLADDGVGFDPEQPRHEHFGLQTMRERADSCNGHFEIESKPNQGTRIHIYLPCRSAK